MKTYLKALWNLEVNPKTKVGKAVATIKVYPVRLVLWISVIYLIIKQFV